MSDGLMLSVKLRLYPTKSQEIQFKKFCGIARFAYNECLAYRIDMYTNHNISVSIQDCIKHLQELKYQDEYAWLCEAPEAVTKQAIKDLDKAYKRFFKEKKGFPKFKKRGKCKESFYQRTDNFKQFDKTHIKITGIKQPVKCQCFVFDGEAVNPRVTFDGKYWYLTFAHTVETDKADGNGVLGVDLGVKNFVTVSDGRVYKNINKGNTIRGLEKRKKRLQKQLSRKFEMNKDGNRFVKTGNILKLQHKLRLLDRRIANIRNTYIHEVTKDLVRTKPKTIVIVDLNVKGMLKNRHLARAIQNCEFGKFRIFLTYKCKLYGVNLIVADRFYSSSKMCSCCGTIKPKLSLSVRTYVCDNCGYTVDRDLNASVNLIKYAVHKST